MVVSTKKARQLNVLSFQSNLAREFNRATEEIAEMTVDFTREYYLKHRKKMVHNLITQSIRIDESGMRGLNSSVRIHIGGETAPYAIYVDRGFRSRSGHKVFEGYHFSEAAREFADKIGADIIENRLANAITGGL